MVGAKNLSCRLQEQSHEIGWLCKDIEGFRSILSEAPVTLPAIEHAVYRVHNAEDVTAIFSFGGLLIVKFRCRTLYRRSQSFSISIFFFLGNRCPRGTE